MTSITFDLCVQIVPGNFDVTTSDCILIANKKDVVNIPFFDRSSSVQLHNNCNGTPLCAVIPVSTEDFFDYGGGNTGAGIVAIDNGGNTELWHTTALEAATTVNSHQVATLNTVNTTALDSTSFHLAV